MQYVLCLLFQFIFYKSQPNLATSVKMFKQGDIVWVNLGISYSWWPGEFQEVSKDADNKTSCLEVKINNAKSLFNKDTNEQNGDKEKNDIQPMVSKLNRIESNISLIIFLLFLFFFFFVNSSLIYFPSF